MFRLSSSGIGLNRVKLNALNADNPDDFPVYTAGQEPVAFIKRLPKEPLVQTWITLFLALLQTVMGRRPQFCNSYEAILCQYRSNRRSSTSQGYQPQYVRVALNDMKENMDSIMHTKPTLTTWLLSPSNFL